MAINTGVSPFDIVPGTRHKFTYQLVGSGLTPLPRKVAIVASRKGGSAIDGQVYEVADALETEGLFGVGSDMSVTVQGCLKIAELMGNIGPRMYAVSIAEPGAGTARTHTFTFSGNATSGGQITFFVHGVAMTIAVAVGNTPTELAAACVDIVNRNRSFLPVTAANAAGVLTFTAVTKGVLGNDIGFSFDNRLPGGVSIVSATGAAGAGVLDTTAALTALAGQQYDAIALCNHTTTDIAVGLSHVTNAWLPSEKRWRILFYGETGAIGLATTLAVAANDRAIVVTCYEGCPELPGVVAAKLAFRWACATRPNASLASAKVAIAAPLDSLAFTPGEQNTAALNGVTAFIPVKTPDGQIVQGQAAISKLVTTSTTEGGQPSAKLRNIGVPWTGAFLARQIDIGYAQRFTAEEFPDGVPFDDTEVIQRVLEMDSAIYEQAQNDKIIRNLAADMQKWRFERDQQVPERLNQQLHCTVVVDLEQIATDHRVAVGG